MVGDVGMAQSAGRTIYELRHYEIDTVDQATVLLAFLRDAALPALNRAGIEPVGVFVPDEGVSPITLLLPHSAADSVVTLTARLLADEEFLVAGAAVLDAPASAPAYRRLVSSLLLAFEGMPAVERPVEGSGRVFQLRIYESPSVKTGQKKIEMFNESEIAIFRKTGMNPVFFGEAIAGPGMPNLTYLLGFESREEQDAAWQRFLADPEWQELRALPDYADDRILCGITNLLLRPAGCSQV